MSTLNRFKSVMKIFEKKGWTLYNNSDYIDYEKEISITDEHGLGEPFDSLNMQVTLDVQNNSLYAVIGENNGSGFNAFMQIGGEGIKRLPSRESIFGQLKEENPEAYQKIIQHEDDFNELFDEFRAIYQASTVQVPKHSFEP